MNRSSNKKQLIILAILFFLTVLLRGSRLPETFSFNAEYNYKLWAVKRIVEDRRPTLIGLEAVNYLHHLHYPPFALYFLSPFYILGQGHPFSIEIAEIVLNGVTSIILFLLGKAVIDWRFGVLMSSIYATSFFVQQVDRFVWVVGPVIFFSSLYLLVISSLTKQKVTKIFFLLGLLVGFAMNFHYQTIALVFGTIIFIVQKYKRTAFLKTITYFFFGISLFFLPWVVFELRHDFYNLRGLWLLYKDSTNVFSESSFDNLAKTAEAFGRLPLNIFLDINFNKNLHFLSFIFQLFIIPSLVYSSKKISPKIHSVTSIWAVLWIFALFTFPFVQNRYYDVSYYTNFLIPGYILFISLLISITIKLFSKSVYFFIILFLFFVAVNSSKSINLKAYLPWKDQKEAISYILKEAPQNDYQIKFLDINSEEFDFMFYYLTKRNFSDYNKIHYIERWHTDQNFQFILSLTDLGSESKRFGNIYVKKIQKS